MNILLPINHEAYINHMMNFVNSYEVKSTNFDWRPNHALKRFIAVKLHKELHVPVKKKKEIVNFMHIMASYYN